MENIIAEHERYRPSFIRTSNGAEIDLILERGGMRHVFEFKLSKAPRPSRGFYELIKTLKPESAAIIAPVDETYEIHPGIRVCPPSAIERGGICSQGTSSTASESGAYQSGT